jgi:hypothetical protein
MTTTTTMNRAAVEADIKETLGLVPHFFSAIPISCSLPSGRSSSGSSSARR